MSTADIIAHIIAPFFYPFYATQRIHWLYMGGAVLLAVFAYLVARRRRGGAARENAQPGGRPGGKLGGRLGGFLAFCFPKGVFTHRSAIVDYKYFFINKGVATLLWGPLVLGAGASAGAVADGLAALTGLTDGLGLAPGPWSMVWLTLWAALAMDLAIFITHYLQHKVPALWEFHKVHHSAEVLTPITIYRLHPVDIVFSASTVGLFTGAVHGFFDFAYAGPVGEFVLLKVNAVIFAYYLLGYNLRHSHVWLAYPDWLSRIFVSPALHQIHHSAAPEHADRNLGFVLSVWDWMLGTLYLPKGRERLEFGLQGGEHREFDGVWRLYSLPVRKLAARFGRRPA